MTIHLREFLVHQPESEKDRYPFNIPALETLHKLEFSSPVTIFVGENGSGKSTLLESIARAARLVSVGSEELDRDVSLHAIKPLADVLKMVWNKRTHRGFFLRAEDFFGFVKRLHSIQAEMQAELTRIDRNYQERSEYARMLAKTPAISSLKAVEERYGADMNAQSHGESFLTLFQSRFVPGGLYLLDELEAALSPVSQLGLILMIKEMVQQEAQFIMATHSPILMAIPDAVLFDFDQNPPVVRSYDDLELVQLYRSFLNDPDAYLNRL